VTAQRRVVGHAVRATYLYSGMADVAARTGAPGYREALESVCQDLVSSQLYLTGGIGARDTFVAPSEPAQIPTGHLLAVPYFSWANRGPGEMAVWLPTGAAAGPDS